MGGGATLLKPNSLIRPSPDVIAQRMGDSVVIVHLQTNRMYDLNRTAARLWELLGEGTSYARLHDCMLREFDVNPAALTREIDGLLTSLEDRDLVRVQEGDQASP